MIAITCKKTNKDNRIIVYYLIDMLKFSSKLGIIMFMKKLLTFIFLLIFSNSVYGNEQEEFFSEFNKWLEENIQK